MCELIYFDCFDCLAFALSLTVYSSLEKQHLKEYVIITTTTTTTTATTTTINIIIAGFGFVMKSVSSLMSMSGHPQMSNQITGQLMKSNSLCRLHDTLCLKVSWEYTTFHEPGSHKVEQPLEKGYFEQ